MRIFKFGGASVKDAAGVKNVARVLQHEGTNDCLLVVSAMGKMTNAFEEVVAASCYRAFELELTLDKVKEYHWQIIKELFHKNDPIYEKVTSLFNELAIFLETNKQLQYDYVYDQVVCYGELLSTNIISAYFNSVGIVNQWNDVRGLIKTDATYRDAKVDWKETEARIQKNIDVQKLNIVQGFLGGAKKGTSTTLGREGSDYTAGIFAYCLNAESVTIWKDVDGVLNGDPRVFNDTILLEKISYEETIEMAFYGASVIHPKTIQPLQSKEIPLYVRSFLDTSKQGTKVSRGVRLQPYIPCFIVKTDQILVSIAAKDFSFMVEENISEIFRLLHQYQLKVNLIQNSAISFSVCVDNKFHQFDAFYEQLKTDYNVEYTKHVSLFTVRHFTDKSLESVYDEGTPLLTQINKETAQVIIKPKAL